ncbi:MAG: iron chelate uptake ABC transporter family permease subunit [Calditrichia bacterium]
MSSNTLSTGLLWSIGFLILTVVFWLNLSLGSVDIPLLDVLNILSGGDASKRSWKLILLDFRLPRAITAVLAGMSLSVAGLMMQTLFRNPLAGPFVLGISSGASLGVALYVMAGSLLSGWMIAGSSWGLIISATIGASAVMLLVVAASLRISDSVSLLIIGLMFGSTTGALVSILQFFSAAELLQSYIIWTFGSLSGVSWSQLAVLAPLVLLGILVAIFSQKMLNGFLLGENYAGSLGISVAKTRMVVILATSLLAGGITAFCGPIAFVGLAIPHLARYAHNTADHRILIPSSILIGSIAMLIFDLISQLPGQEATLPLNAITALFGAPVVIWVILRNRQLKSPMS